MTINYTSGYWEYNRSFSTGARYYFNVSCNSSHRQSNISGTDSIQISGGREVGGLFVIDTKKEAIAVAEANKLNIPVFGVMDTNCDPDPIDYPIPANDDAFKSISLLVHTMADAVLEGKSKMSQKVEEDEKGEEPVIEEAEKIEEEG